MTSKCIPVDKCFFIMIAWEEESGAIEKNGARRDFPLPFVDFLANLVSPNTRFRSRKLDTIRRGEVCVIME